jgi:hypothetical protein
MNSVCVTGLSFLFAVAQLLAGIGDGSGSDLESLLSLSAAPACVVGKGDGWLVGMDQAERPLLRCAWVDKAGNATAYPTEGMAKAMEGEHVPLHAVEDIYTGTDGIVWILDNGRRAEATPKLVGWNKKDVQVMYHLSSPATVPGSFLTEMVVDPESPLVVIADPAGDSNAALIVLDRTKGVARRLLQGHPALLPDKTVSFPAAAQFAVKKRLDGRDIFPRGGLSSLAIDDDGEWLYFAPLLTRKVYRLPMKALRNATLPPEELAKAVTPYADCGPCSAMAMDEDGNLYLGDLAVSGICVVHSKDQKREELVADARLAWPHSLTFGEDGLLYFVSRAPQGGKLASSALATPAAHWLYRVKPLAEGMVGR